MTFGSPIAALAAIVRAIQEAAADRARLGDLLTILERVEIFNGTVALASSAGSDGFVPTDARGKAGDARDWRRWPLRRLFATMRPRRVVHPKRPQRALAIPFDYSPERCVVIAIIDDGCPGESFELLFETVEHLSVPRAPLALTLPDEIPLFPVDPRLMGFGLCADLSERLSEILTRRAWSMTVPETYLLLRETVHTLDPDVLFVDLDRRLDAFEAIVRVQKIVPTDTKIFAFGCAKEHDDLVRQGLVDVLIEHDADESLVFDRLKAFVRKVPETRKTRLRRVTAVAERAMLSSRNPLELCSAGAQHAADLMRGWAAVHLVSESGAVFAAEHPRFVQPVMEAIPNAFLSDAPLFQLRADDRFYAEMTDDDRVRGALARIGGVSAASIPLRHGEHRLGTLVSISQNVPADSYAFEALDNVAKLMTLRFEEFARRSAPVSLDRRGVWECVRHGGLEFAVYRARNAALAWDFRAVRPDLGIFAIGTAIDAAAAERLVGGHASVPALEMLGRMVGDGCSFAAACNPITGSIAYAARGFPVPLLFDARGPAGAVTKFGETIRGTTTIVPPAGLLVWDETLRRWFARESGDPECITELLEDMRPPGMGVLITATVPTNLAD